MATSKNLELAEFARNLTVNASGEVTDLQIDPSNIDGFLNFDLAIAPEVLEIQVSAPAAGQDTAWLWTWEQSTLPYARRTITNSPEISVPLYKQGTYTINNYAAYDLFDSMTQTHTLYLKWIDGAGTDNLVSWATSTGPVSDSHPDINGGAATDVQRISVNVPSTITLPTLTAPSVSYTVTNNGSGAYTFSGSASGDNPNIGPFYRGGTYTFNVTATGHPLYLTTDNGTNFSAGTYFGEYTSGVTGSRTDSGTITFTVPSNAPDTLYYQCGNHSAMRGAITIKDLAVETNINGNYVIYAQHTQEGHKTPIELRPIPSLVNQMCLVYDSSTGKFVPQDLATYVENTPSFENKIREVAGTAELVVEDGSTVVAKVNVYDDSTYLPLTGNNAGDQAFATDTNILYIWDGSSWQQAGTTNTDDLTEGSTNLFYTDARADARVTAGIASLVDSAPTTLDTLNELAAALGDDPNFATTITGQIGTKVNTADFNSLWDARFASDSTTNLAEGTNLYYTDARADARIAAATTDDLSEGSTNLYFLYDRVRATNINAGSLRGTVNNATVQYGTAYSGTPVQGSFFFDSLNQKLKVYTGSAFVDAVPAGSGSSGGGSETSANATFRKYTYSITSSTNAVSGADDNTETLSYSVSGNQNVEVYVNGVKQVEGAANDYVATTGTSITFVDNLSSGDVVDVQVYELLTNDAYYLKTETYTQTEVNSQIATGLAGYVPSTGGTFTGNVYVDTNIGIGTDSPGNNEWSNGAKFLTIDATSNNSYGVLSLKGDRNSTGTTRAFQIGAGDGNLYLAYDDVNNNHRIVVFPDGDIGFGDDATLATGGNYGRNIHLHSTSGGASLKLSDGSTGRDTASGFEIISVAQAGYVWNREPAKLSFATSNLERMKIESDGQMAIGTTTADSNNVLTISNEDNAATYPAIALGSATTGSGNGEGLWIGMLETGRSYLWNYEADDLWLGTNSIDRLVITADGNVGIGSTTPNVKLQPTVSSAVEWVGTANLSNATNKPNVALQLQNDDTSITATEVNMLFSAGASGSAQHSIGVKRSGTNTGDMIFRRRTGGATSAETLRITNAGRVGINTDNPNAKVTINNATADAAGNGLAVRATSNNSGALVAQSQSYENTFGILPWSSGRTYLSSGTYYDSGTWKTLTTGGASLLSMSGNEGMYWYAGDGTADDRYEQYAANKPILSRYGLIINNEQSYNTGYGAGARTDLTSTSWVTVYINGTGSTGDRNPNSGNVLKFEKLDNNSDLQVSVNFPYYMPSAGSGVGIRMRVSSDGGSTYANDFLTTGPAHGWGAAGYGGDQAGIINYTWNTESVLASSAVGTIYIYFEMRCWSSADTAYVNMYQTSYNKYGYIHIKEVSRHHA